MDDLTDPEDLEIYKEYLVKNINARFDAFEQQLLDTIGDVDIDMEIPQAEPTRRACCCRRRRDRRNSRIRRVC